MKDQPNVQESPAPVAPQSVAPAPTQQWQQTPPVQAQVQYVVAQQSLDGLSGWLMFWVIIFGLNGIGYAVSFFSVLGSGFQDPSQTLLAIFAPILSACYIGSVVLISMRKKLAILASMVTIGVATLYSVINTIIATSGNNSSESSSITVSMIVGSLMFGGLVVLYFLTSKRVKATLVG